MPSGWTWGLPLSRSSSPPPPSSPTSCPSAPPTADWIYVSVGRRPTSVRQSLGFGCGTWHRILLLFATKCLDGFTPKSLELVLFIVIADIPFHIQGGGHRCGVSFSCAAGVHQSLTFGSGTNGTWHHILLFPRQNGSTMLRLLLYDRNAIILRQALHAVFTCYCCLTRPPPHTHTSARSKQMLNWGATVPRSSRHQRDRKGYRRTWMLLPDRQQLIAAVQRWSLMGETLLDCPRQHSPELTLTTARASLSGRVGSPMYGGSRRTHCRRMSEGSGLQKRNK